METTNVCDNCVKARQGTAVFTAVALQLCVMPRCAAVPTGLWDDASFKATGNLFWPDFWVSPATSEHLDIVYDMVGLKYMEAEASVLLIVT